MGIGEHMPVCVFVGANESEGCQPCPEQPSFTPPEMWHKETTEQVRERVCLCFERVCVCVLSSCLTNDGCI